MAQSDKRTDLASLVFQHRWLETQLSSGYLSAGEEASMLNDIEALDLKVAVTPCVTVGDLGLKLELLADLFWPSSEPMPEDCLEHIMLAALIRDARAFPTD